MLMPDLAAGPGPLTRDGQTFNASIQLTQLGRPISIDDWPQPVEVTWNLGTPPPGTYTFRATLPGTPAQTRQTTFIVPGAPRPPIAAIFITKSYTGPWNATVQVSLPAGQTVTSWGPLQTTGNQFKVAITTGPIPDPAPPTRDLSRTYDLGLPAPGTYTFSVYQGDTQLATRTFPIVVIPARQPQLASVVVRQGDTSTSAEVSVLLPQPGYSVASWGDATRDGTNLNAALLITIDPVVPAIALPSILVKHTYSLGTLPAGEYRFNLSY